MKTFTPFAQPLETDAAITKQVPFFEFMGKIQNLDYYQNLFEGQSKSSNTVNRTVNKKTGVTTTWRYEFNLEWGKSFRHLANKFQRLPKDFKNYILAAREDNVYWRGEELSHYASVYDETLLYRALSNEGKAHYRGRIKDILKRL